MASKTKRRKPPARKAKRAVETPGLTRIGSGPALGSAMPASAAGQGWGRSRGGGRTSQRTRETHPWVEADAKRVYNSILSALRGDPAPLQDTFDDILDRDERVANGYRTRGLALTALTGSVKAPKGAEQDADAQLNAKRCQRVIDAIEEWPLAISRMAEGICRSYSVQEKYWKINSDGWWVIDRIEWRHPNRFAFDGNIQICRREMGETWPGTPLEQVKPDGWIVHIPTAGRAAYPMRGGLMLTCIPMAMAKRHGWKYWLKGSEKYGVPLPVARVPAGEDNDDLAEEALEVMRKMNADWGAVFRGDIELTKVEGSGEYTGEIHQKLVEVANTSISILFLGQAQTSEAGTGQVGTYASSKIANLVRLDLRTADAIEMAVTIRRQVLEPLCRVNQWAGPVPIYEFDLGLRDVPSIDDVKEGIASEDERRESMGWPKKSDGAGAKYRAPQIAVPFGGPQPVPAQPQAGGGGDPAGPFDRSRRTPATSGATIPKGTMPTSSRGGPTSPS